MSTYFFTTEDIDNTLTQKGKIADAFALGEIIRDLYSQIDSIISGGGGGGGGGQPDSDPDNPSESGVGIASIEVVESTEDGGENIITIMMTDFTEIVFSVRNGRAGKPGTTPSIKVGTVTTLDAGSEAYVERDPSSPDSAPVLNFGIPKGEPTEAIARFA